MNTQEITLIKSQTHATLNNTAGMTLIFRNGVLQSPNGDYTITGQSLDLARPADDDEYITAVSLL